MKASPLNLAGRIALATLLSVSALIHAQLYLHHGYRSIHLIGPAFLLQASTGFAAAVLILVTNSPIIRLQAAGVVIGALSGFAASRTIGIAGFSERGFAPAPQAAISVIVEVASLVILAVMFAAELRSRPQQPRPALARSWAREAGRAGRGGPTSGSDPRQSSRGE